MMKATSPVSKRLERNPAPPCTVAKAFDRVSHGFADASRVVKGFDHFDSFDFRSPLSCEGWAEICCSL
jgi:hypothetical protein